MEVDTLRSNTVRVFRVCASLLGGMAVAGGAFGAHSLKEVLSPSDLEVFQTAVRYQMWHALALLVLSSTFVPTRTAVIACYLMLIGTLLFSGSLYVLSLGGPSWVGPLTPVGGGLLITGWVLLAFAAVNRGRRQKRFNLR